MGHFDPRAAGEVKPPWLENFTVLKLLVSFSPTGTIKTNISDVNLIRNVKNLQERFDSVSGDK